MQFPGKLGPRIPAPTIGGGCNLSRDRSLTPVYPGGLMLHPYYIPERKTRPRGGRSRRWRKIEVDGPRDPFVCGNGLPTGREDEGGSGGAMATREERRTCWDGGRGGEEDKTPGACYFGSEARHARRRQAPRATPRRRPRVMKPRPPQSKHASSLLTALDLSYSFLLLVPFLGRRVYRCPHARSR